MAIILKSDNQTAAGDQRMVWGWASVTSINGMPVVDSEGHRIDSADVQKAAHEFMSSERSAGYIHRKGPDGKVLRSGEILESIFFTAELQKALGIDFGQEGWFVGVRVDDDKAWGEAKAGDLIALSIGGVAVEEPD